MTKVKVDTRGGLAIDAHKENFLTLMAAFENGDVILVQCKHATTGEDVTAICTIESVDNLHKDDPEKQYDLTPFAVFLNENPYDVLIPPDAKELDDASVH